MKIYSILGNTNIYIYEIICESTFIIVYFIQFYLISVTNTINVLVMFRCSTVERPVKYLLCFVIMICK